MSVVRVVYHMFTVPSVTRASMHPPSQGADEQNTIPTSHWVLVCNRRLHNRCCSLNCLKLQYMLNFNMRDLSVWLIFAVCVSLMSTFVQTGIRINITTHRLSYTVSVLSQPSVVSLQYQQKLN